ncbi:hypothetical protein PSN01_00327 [Micromonospora saelicesensis]|nr:hypothetical protein PSN01_00327 [Micromonospora saelicesensis]
MANNWTQYPSVCTGSAMNWASPTTATSSPMVSRPCSASQPANPATVARKRPLTVVVSPRCRPLVVAARRVTSSA